MKKQITLRINHTIGEYQELYERYDLGISKHTKETQLLCEIILNLENRTRNENKEDIKCPECNSEAYHVLYCLNKDCWRYQHG